jgi:catechol 2,3-dioxygenase-like lactoylglutathione lyase family enzyme
MTIILRSAPYFPVANVEQSAAFYQNALGFTVEYSGGTPIEFAICSRDGTAIMFRKVPAPELIRPNEAQGGTWDAFFWVDDVLAMHAEFAARGVAVVYGPIVQTAYRMHEFAVRDQDGHVLGFGQSLAG